MLAHLMLEKKRKKRKEKDESTHENNRNVIRMKEASAWPNNPKRNHSTYLSNRLSLSTQILRKRVTIGSKSFTYFKNFVLCSFSRVEYYKNIFLNLQIIIHSQRQSVQ